jgi:hypothetical protein
MNTIQRSRPTGPATGPAGPATGPAGPATGPAGPATGPAGPAESAGRAHHYLRPIAVAMICALVALVAVSPFLLAFATSSPARAATTSLPHPGAPVSPSPVPAQIHTAVAGGMPGWQITLIAVLAAQPLTGRDGTGRAV